MSTKDSSTDGDGELKFIESSALIIQGRNLGIVNAPKHTANSTLN